MAFIPVMKDEPNPGTGKGEGYFRLTGRNYVPRFPGAEAALRREFDEAFFSRTRLVPAPPVSRERRNQELYQRLIKSKMEDKTHA
jgi:hypothetical protein